MTPEELKVLSTEEFNVLSTAIANEAVRRTALANLQGKVKANVDEYKGWGGSTADLLSLLEDTPATDSSMIDGPGPSTPEEPAETVDPVVEVEPEETPTDEGYTF